MLTVIVQGVFIFGSVCPSLTPRPFADLTDLTLADEDTKSMLTDNANRAIQANVVAKFATYASGAIWWPYLQLMQVAPSGGQICN